MHYRHRAVLATGLLLLSAVAVFGITRPRASAPTSTYAPSVNALDIDLAAGTPMPPLPTALPEGWTITSADEALARVWGRPRPGVEPDAVIVRLANNWIVNWLCDRQGSGLMPEEDLVWVVALGFRGLTDRDVRAMWPPHSIPILNFGEPTPGASPTPLPTPTPAPVAGLVYETGAVSGIRQYPMPLYFANTPGHECWTMDTIRALRSLPDAVARRPTESPMPMRPTPSLDEILGTDGLTATMGVTGTMGLTSTRSYTDWP